MYVALHMCALKGSLCLPIIVPNEKNIEKRHSGMIAIERYYYSYDRESVLILWFRIDKLAYLIIYL